MGKTKITHCQLRCLTFGVSLGGSVLVVSALMAGIAKHDAWLGAIVTVLAGLPVIGILIFLGKQFPGINYIELLQTIWGPWAGSALAASSVLLWIQLSFHIPWYVGDFITSQSMPETPSYVIYMTYITAIAIVVRYGVEAFARAVEVFMLTSSFLFLFTAALVIPNARIENLLPVLEYGFLPILKSAFFMSCFITYPVFALMMIYPSEVEKPTSAGKSMLTGYLFSGGISFLAIFLSILVLGWPITANTQYSAFFLAREIKLGVIFSRIEYIIFFSWILTQFILNTLYFYAGVTGIAQLLKLKDHKRIILPFALIVFVLSGIVFPDVPYQENWIVFVWAPYVFLHGFIFPLLTLLLYFIRGGKKKFPVHDEKQPVPKKTG